VSPISHGAIYKKTIFKRIGYVDETFDACEDVEFNYRVEKAGFKTYMSPQLTIKYYPRADLKGLFKQMMRYGEGRFNLIRKHPDAFKIETIAPALFVTGISLILPIGFFKIFLNSSPVDYIIFFWVLIYGLYFLIILLVSIHLSLTNDLTFIFHLPRIFFTIHYASGWGFLKRIIQNFFHIYILREHFI
jgi:GT2 family glycosyltransferase